MTVEEEKLLRHMVSAKAYIVLDEFGDMYPIHAGGNKRSRAKRWIEKSMFKRMLRMQWLVHDGGAVRVSDALQMRILNPETAHADQHRDMSDDTVYVDEGVKRHVARNQGATALQRLARRRDPKGRLRLSPAEVEAGQQFAKDYAMSGIGNVSAQTYDSLRVDGGSSHDGAERAIINSMDRRKRVSEAIACLGPGLDRAVIAVCCENWSVEHVERSEQWARSSGFTILKLALERLAKFYGTHPGEPAQRKPTSNSKRAWTEIKPLRSAS